MTARTPPHLRFTSGSAAARLLMSGGSPSSMGNDTCINTDRTEVALRWRRTSLRWMKGARPRHSMQHYLKPSDEWEHVGPTPMEVKVHI